MLQAWGIVRSFQHLDRIFCHSHFALIFVVIRCHIGGKKRYRLPPKLFQKNRQSRIEIINIHNNIP